MVRAGVLRWVGFCAIACWPLVAAAQPAPAKVEFTGRVEHPRTFALTDLEAAPAITVKVSQVTSQGVREAMFTGALLWTLVGAAHPTDEPGDRTRLRHTLLARGRDGYAVALAIGELDPDYEGKQVLVAYARDGQPLPDLRLVVPGDVHGGRGVRDLVAVEVR